MRSTHSTLLLLSLCTASFPAATLSAQTLLVVNQGDSNTSLINPTTGKTLATVPDNTPGIHGHEIAASADGRTAFVPIYGSSGVGKPGIDGHEILVIDIASHQVVDHIEFDHGVRPHFPILDPASNLLYVTTELDNSISIIDPKTHKIVGAVPTGQPQSHMFAISHDGHRAYTANVGPGTVSVLDLAARKTLAIIPVSKEIQRISISADDKSVFTADQTRPQLAVIDTATNKVSQWIALPATAYGTAATPDGHWLLVTIPSKNQLAIVDLETMKIARTITVPELPQEVIIRPDAKFAYVSCFGSPKTDQGKIATIDLTKWNLAMTISAGSFADGMAWAR